MLNVCVCECVYVSGGMNELFLVFVFGMSMKRNFKKASGCMWVSACVSVVICGYEDTDKNVRKKNPIANIHK